MHPAFQRKIFQQLILATDEKLPKYFEECCALLDCDAAFKFIKQSSHHSRASEADFGGQLIGIVSSLVVLSEGEV